MRHYSRTTRYIRTLLLITVMTTLLSGCAATPNVVRVCTSAILGRSACGTGFFVTSSGLVATASHVVESRLSKTDIVVTLGDSSPRKFKGLVVYDDPVNDLVLIQPYGLREVEDPLPLCKDVPELGDDLKAYAWTSRGRLTEPGKFIMYQGQRIAHTASLYPGFSGGPLMNGDCVAGVNISVNAMYRMSVATDSVTLRYAIESVKGE